MQNTYTPVLHFPSGFEGASYKKYKIQLPFLLFIFVLHHILHQLADINYKKYPILTDSP